MPGAMLRRAYPADLLNQIPKDKRIGSTTNNGVYDTYKCHDTILNRIGDCVMRHDTIPTQTAIRMARIEQQSACLFLGGKIDANMHMLVQSVIMSDHVILMLIQTQAGDCLHHLCTHMLPVGRLAVRPGQSIVVDTSR